MQITDTVGRSMLVDLMYKDGPRWMLAPQHKLKGRGTNHVEVPHGEYAIKLESMTGADVLVFEDGELLISTTVGPRTQHITADRNQHAFTFRPQGDEGKGEPVTDVSVHADTASGAGAGEQADLFTANQVVAARPQAPKGHGRVYVVVRFAKDGSPYGEPPREEFELDFQMHDAESAQRHLAENFHIVVEAPQLPNELDPFSRVAATPEELAHRPCVHCTFGRPHKH
jgi:hypothetical protein